MSDTTTTTTSDTSEDRRRAMSESIRVSAMNGVIGRDLRERFPIGDEFHDSLWDRWEANLRSFHTEERERIMKIGEGWSNPDDVVETRGEEIMMLEELLENMTAALLVTLWAAAEQHLGLQARSVEDGPGIPRLRGKPNIEDLTKRCEAAADCELKQLPGYAAVEVVRIAANSFKHNGGYYRPDKKKDGTLRERDLLPESAPAEWNLPAQKAEFRYRDLPFRTLVHECGRFFSALDDARRAAA